MSKVEQKFKIGDKVAWKDKQSAKDWFPYEIDSVMTVVGHNLYEDNETYMLIMDNGVVAFDFRFELYKEKEMQEFDKSKLITGMRVVHNNGEVGIVLKDIGVIAYVDGFNDLGDYTEFLYSIESDFDEDKLWDIVKVYDGYQKHPSVLDFEVLGNIIWERKEETKQQKRIRELKAIIDNASKQLEELMKETK